MNTNKSITTFDCPKCKKRYKLQPHMMGKNVRCMCGHEMNIPASDAPTAAAPDAGAAPAATTATNETPRPLGGALFAHGGTSAVARALEEREDEPEVSPALELGIPLALSAVGVIVSFLIWMRLSETMGQALTGASIMLALQVLLFVPICVGAAMMTARMMDVGFGPLIPTVIKLAAITIGPGAVADGLIFWIFQHDFDYEYLLVGFVLHMFLQGIPLALMFRLGVKEMSMLVTLMVAPRMGMLFAAAAMMPSLFGLDK